MRIRRSIGAFVGALLLTLTVPAASAHGTTHPLTGHRLARPPHTYDVGPVHNRRFR